MRTETLRTTMPRTKKLVTTASHKRRLKKPVRAKPARRRPSPLAPSKPVYITEDEADVLVSKRREREEELIPWEQVEAELAELD
jgi:hypothetical protein